jgi:hypothetical protein
VGLSHPVPTCFIISLPESIPGDRSHGPGVPVHPIKLLFFLLHGSEKVSEIESEEAAVTYDRWQS